jgi:hypothetical protein
MVRENLHIAHSRQKSYADNRRRGLSFEDWKLRVPYGVTHEKVMTFQGTRQART